MAYPYSNRETVADGGIHALGLVLALPASTLLLMRGDTTIGPALWIYAISLCSGLVASAAYHLLPWDKSRPILGRIDHAMIYFKIAGTYTPFVVIMGTPMGYAVLALIWCIAFIGAFAKLTFWRTDGRGSLALYIAMGWLSVILLGPLSARLPWISLTLLIIGGLTYSAGAVVFAQPALKYQNAIWHSFVLTASTCVFGAIVLAVT